MNTKFQCPNCFPGKADIDIELASLPYPFNQFPIEEQFNLARIRWFCKNNLFYLAYHVLGYNKINTEFHVSICNWLDQNRRNEILLLVPRNHYKSTLVSIAMTIQEILKNRNIRVMITNAVYSLLKEFSREIKGHFESNEKLKRLFPEVCFDKPETQSKKWTETEFIVKRDISVREPTVYFSSVGSMSVGYHFDIIVYDDIVNYENTATDDLISKLDQWYGYTQSLLGGDVYLRRHVGTRYHFDDKYEDIFEEAEENDKLKILVRQAIENNQVIFPGEFSIEKLNKLRTVQGEYIFSCQYMNYPFDRENSKFKEENIMFIEDWKQTKNSNIPNTNNFIIIDLNYTEKEDKTNCFSVINAIGIDSQDNKFLMETFATRDTIDNLLTNLFRMYKTHSPIGRCVYVEKSGNSNMFINLVKKFQKEKNETFGILEIPVKNRDKFSRIMRMQPDFEQHKWWIGKQMTETIDELIKFPKFKYRDIIDCMAYIYDVGFAPKETNYHEEYISWRKRYNFHKQSGSHSWLRA